ncbi:T. brucei spp.-specific protein [Trypanosoma brucei gambiense DAL972]|uniref:T. brucei spp.-specific protein n=2 Tax=Trypanosoma brucei TaxID=5691 RepID=Q581F0_TRYB2|nr:T. brucei spp.-specific protein [Trypanosoma brucei gambiense DAL972]XP_845165.1 hypothetical protein Tb927.6.420 [Trypanosoma brucei brucei TREU927]AAX79582.1 hypothetical protein Tb927.6.420 [Trypanosoma brucei]AAZ11606.1 hypothetical protein Tb927.6.420 [Trypanosoma brucei brucei TREU927]CBH11530.1 T. brucei spp.-specific protein [Trypanosoma brucei gambiense DAL972]|eukprot:XP_011773815.1 T. brucei spp.-specific protein [Trypanosoma brucei gambiense DAL972]
MQQILGPLWTRFLFFFFNPTIGFLPLFASLIRPLHSSFDVLDHLPHDQLPPLAGHHRSEISHLRHLLFRLRAVSGQPLLKYRYWCFAWLVGREGVSIDNIWQAENWFAFLLASELKASGWYSLENHDRVVSIHPQPLSPRGSPLLPLELRYPCP